MDLKEGDLVITLPKVEKIKAIVENMEPNKIGVITSVSSKFAGKEVYGVLIDGKEYFLFSDEIEKMEI
jgi:hypothetical protein